MKNLIKKLLKTHLENHYKILQIELTSYLKIVREVILI